jgi:hypothetical protein
MEFFVSKAKPSKAKPCKAKQIQSEPSKAKQSKVSIQFQFQFQSPLSTIEFQLVLDTTHITVSTPALKIEPLLHTI